MTPWTVCSPPGSSVHGVLQARILEWVAIFLSMYVYVHVYYIYHSFIHLSVDKKTYLGFLAIVNNAAMNLRVQISFEVSVSVLFV